MAAPLISTADAKAHCRVYHTQDDAYIADIVTRVVAEWELVTHWPLSALEVVAVYDSLPDDRTFRHQQHPVDLAAGGVVTWTSTAGSAQTQSYLAAVYRRVDGYTLLTPTAEQAALWVYPISYTYTAGSLTLLPTIKTALLLRIGYLYSYRGDDASPPDETAWLMLTARYRTGALL